MGDQHPLRSYKLTKAESLLYAKQRLIKIFKHAKIGDYQTSIYSFKEIITIWVNYNSYQTTNRKINLVYETREYTTFYIS